MNTIEKLCEKFLKDLRREDFHSVEFLKSDETSMKLYSELYQQLNEEQKNRLRIYDDQFGLTYILGNEDGFREGFLAGFGFALRLLSDAFRIPMFQEKEV